MQTADQNALIIQRMGYLINKYDSSFFNSRWIGFVVIFLLLIAIAFSAVAFGYAMKYRDTIDNAQDGEKASQFLTYLFPEYSSFTPTN